VKLSATDVRNSYCTLATTRRVEVTVQLTYSPVLTGFFYKKHLTVHGTAAAESITGPAD
jgi:hypothetical protein